MKYARIHQLGGIIRPKGGGRLVFSLGGKLVFAKKVTIPADALPKPVKPPLATTPAIAEEAAQPSPLLPEAPVEGALAPDRPMPEAKPVDDTPVIDAGGVQHD